VLLKKFFNVGFVEIEVVERTAFGLDELGRYPLFAPEFLQFLRDAIPTVRHRELVFSIAVTARRPEAIAAAPAR
jgi:hypothetical protein